MNARTLQAAIAEAERFLDLARELQAQANHNNRIYVEGNAASGATRLASKNLTHALAVFLRPK